MNYGIYALYDRVRNSYGQISLDTNDETAKRGFMFAVSQDKQLQYISKDLELYKIGEMAAETGIVVPLSVHQLICRGEEYAN